MDQLFAGYDEQRRIQSFFDGESRPDGLRFIEITSDQHAMLIAGMAAGKTMAIDESGQPTLLDPPKQTREQLADMKRAMRDAALRATDWLTARHQDEKALGDGTTLTPELYAQLLKYRQALRDFSEMPGWPTIDLPTAPSFLTSST
ncbi:MAG: phage tail assembly chaperone [Burkholderia contaminans]|uniref:phage tail assembly chaperone n=1 Tax=Burkholderia contaminans TaxID=488447 RepID=UPI002D80D4B1|nr:phage tail assembly chaperone [Burkholderia contaminans]